MIEFATIIFLLGIFALFISVAISMFLFMIDETQIGNAIRDYILSKIVKTERENENE